MGALPGKLKDKAEDTGAQMAHKFLDVPTDDYPAAAQLDAAFATDAPKPAQDQPPAPASQVGDLAAQAFSDALGFALPGFVKTIVSEIMETDVDLLREIYKQLLPWDQSQTIPANEILEAGREALLDRALDLLTLPIFVSHGPAKEPGRIEPAVAAGRQAGNFRPGHEQGRRFRQERGGAEDWRRASTPS